MAYVSMKELLEAGVHFGHQTKRWNPKMKTYIFGARNGIYIIDLQKTVKMFKTAYDFMVETAAAGKSVLFVGTKKQAKEAIYEEANRCEMFYVHNRWLGGMMTNFQTIRKSIERLNYLNTIHNDGSINLFPKKERLKLAKEREKLDSNLGGIRSMERTPGRHFRHRSQERGHCRARRRDGSRFPSWRWWTPTATRMRSTTRSPATTMPSAPFAC